MAATYIIKSKQPLITIVGETASGKSQLALQLAQRFNGEIVCADSASVRRGIDIGTAKPTTEEQTAVPHHLLNIIDPSERFTAARFKQLAEQAIEDISARGNLAIMVGGTGLYIDAVLYDYKFGVKEATDRQQIRTNILVLGVKVDRQEFRQRIEKRVDNMLAAGLEGEARRLAEHYGWDCPALKNIGYAQWRDYFGGTKTLPETRQLIIKSTLDLAKRQRTWFKRNNSIQWLNTPVNLAEVVASVTAFLNT